MSIETRKADHLDVCVTQDVGFRSQGTLLDCVRLIHQSLPELAADEIDTRTRFFDKELKAPLFIAAMTGGTERAEAINLELAAIAERRGYGFGVGSQRVMQRKPETARTFNVRKVAPNALLLGNLGAVQARELRTDDVQALVAGIGADALCVHLNPAMELIQSDGDRDFRGCLAAVERLARELSVPVVVKETGSGISLRTAQRLREAGVQTVDVSGAGGTSWVGVEAMRATGGARQLGELLWDWGIPTAASVAWSGRAGLRTIATGGIRTGLDVARAIALGASAAGIARPVLQALTDGGKAAAEALLDGIERELRAVMLLCGARTLTELQRAPRVIIGELRSWVEAEPLAAGTAHGLVGDSDELLS